MFERNSFNDAMLVKIPSVAVIIPCFNEESTIFNVVKKFREILPCASIYVYDNCSTDNTYGEAEKAGAMVVKSRKRGKGNVVRKMFSDINADMYLMVDGDDTYSAEDAVKMLDLIRDEQMDMVIAARNETSDKAYPTGHKWGNKLFNFTLRLLFGGEFKDIFSGYRAFSKRFVKTFPITSNGFDIEAELSIHALTLSLPCAEINSDYRERPENSHSKLSTFKDGFKILWSILKLLKENRPLLFFGIISLILFLLSIGLAYPILFTFLKTGLVPRLPTAVLSTGIMMISFLSLTCGTILNSISQARIEIKKLHYLQYDIVDLHLSRKEEVEVNCRSI